MMEKRSWSEAFCNYVDRKRARERRPVGFVMTDDGPARLDDLWLSADVADLSPQGLRWRVEAEARRNA
jgi:hypothetical protein